jgi:hypothetical protein
LNWAAPTENEDISGEVLVASFSGSQTVVETDYDPLATFTIFGAGATISPSSYTMDSATGLVTLNADAANATDEITIDYTTTLSDLDGYVLLRVKGGSETFTDHGDIVGQSGAVTVSDSLASGATSTVETLTASENGESHVYYLFALDDESSPNYSDADLVAVDTIPTIPQNLAKTVSENKVVLSWDEVTDDNCDGYNIYRNDGASLDQSALEQLNSSIIAAGSPTFDDSADNSSNRVSEGTVAYPGNGSSYTYVVESEDTTSVWTTGTVNTISGQSANLVASLTAA